MEVSDDFRNDRTLEMKDPSKISDFTTLIEQTIRDIPDFPQKGIMFKDITPVLRNPLTLKHTARLLHEAMENREPDVVAGIESRGFLFGPGLASSLNAGFVPVRKPGKLPSDKVAVRYELEYGTDQLEMHTDAIRQGERVVIHDDLLATGGSAKASTRLVEQLGGVVVAYSFVVELTFLNGRDQLPPGIPVFSIVRY